MSRRHSASGTESTQAPQQVEHRNGPVKSRSHEEYPRPASQPFLHRGVATTSAQSSVPVPSCSSEVIPSLHVGNGAGPDSPVHQRRTMPSSQGLHSVAAGRASDAPPLPGRPTRRIRRTKTKGHKGFCYRLYVRWVRSSGTVSSSLPASASTLPSSSPALWIAVALWYSLGVVSIGTSKILLSDHELGSLIGNVPPIYLTLQQLLIGSTLLRLWIVSSSASGGVLPWPVRGVAVTAPDHGDHDQHHYPISNKSLQWRGSSQRKTVSSTLGEWSHLRNVHPSLAWAALFFGLGFLLTNLGFSGADASFVETIKASEPITSASVAVWWGIEVLTAPEVGSLVAIVFGVVLSTVGSRRPASSPATTDAAVHSMGRSAASTSLVSCIVVLLSNMCFSFRGLHQKLFRATPEGSASAMDDLNLQFRMQQLGAVGLVLPVLVVEGRSLVRTVWHVFVVLPLQEGDGEESDVGLAASLRLVAHYLFISVCNGCAFTFYNLSSTYILSRITVVHHAALNCIRRVFAILVTSAIFRVPVTLTGATGILCSVGGFMAFSHYKMTKQHNASTQHTFLPTSVATHSHIFSREQLKY